MSLPVFINNDAGQAFSNQVTLTLTQEDVSDWGSIGSITGVQLSQNPSFAGVSWQNWSRSIPFTLSPGNGLKTVYIRFTDGTNQVTSSDSIILGELSSAYLPIVQR